MIILLLSRVINALRYNKNDELLIQFRKDPNINNMGRLLSDIVSNNPMEFAMIDQ